MVRSNIQEDRTVEAWLEAACHGDCDALGRLLERFRPRLNRIAQQEIDRSLRSKVSHSDIVQDTFAEAHAGVPMLREKTLAGLDAWLLGILRHRLANLQRDYLHTKKRAAKRELALGPNSRATRWLETLPGCITPPSERARRHERDDAIAEAIAQLSEHDHQLVAWRLRDELTFEQIALKLGKSADAVRQSYYRALKRLKTILGPGHAPC